jgi:hypothetical protein
MAITNLLRFFSGSARHARVDERELREAGADAGRHHAYHRRIVWISVLSGLFVGAVGCTNLWNEIFRAGESQTLHDWKLIYLSPLLFGAAGLLLGAAAGCAFAPRAFLNGPIGRRWIRLAGVRSTAGARVVFATVALVIAGVVTFLALAPTLEAHGYLPKHGTHRR